VAGRRIDIVGELGKLCVDYGDGEKLYAKLHKVVARGGTVTLDFSSVDVFASPFFNAAIGQLLKDFDAEQLNRCLQFKGLAPQGEIVLKRTIENARRYYGDTRFRKAVRKVIDESSGDTTD
jgi:hypothetical protein